MVLFSDSSVPWGACVRSPWDSWEKGKLFFGKFFLCRTHGRPRLFSGFFFQHFMKGEHCFSGNWMFHVDPHLPQGIRLIVLIAQNLHIANSVCVLQTIKPMLFKGLPYCIHWHSKEWGCESALKMQRQILNTEVFFCGFRATVIRNSAVPKKEVRRFYPTG